MARMRTIKPSFFLNEKLADLDPMANLLFIGLWTQADREGRLEDNPRRLKAALFPYHPHTVADLDQWLDDLQGDVGDPDSQFIRRYEVGGRRYIQISTFGKHQTPHQKELPSSIPPAAETENPLTATAQAQSEPQEDLEAEQEDPAPTQHQPSTNPAPGKVQTSTEPAQVQHSSNGSWVMGSGSGNDCESASARPPTRVVPDNPVGIWQDVFDALLPIPQADVVNASAIENLALWRDVLTNWRANSYSPRNISGMIDSYKRRLKLHSEQVAKGNVVSITPQINQTPGICTNCWGQETVVKLVDGKAKGRIPCPKCAVKTGTG